MNDVTDEQREGVLNTLRILATNADVISAAELIYMSDINRISQLTQDLEEYKKEIERRKERINFHMEQDEWFLKEIEKKDNIINHLRHEIELLKTEIEELNERNRTIGTLQQPTRRPVNQPIDYRDRESLR